MNNLVIETKSIRQADGLYSLNDLHKASGGSKHNQPSNFIRLKQTLGLIEQMKRSSDMRNIVNVQAKVGTYVCKQLVYAYAMWISPEFYLHVINTFDQIQQPTPQLTPELQAALNDRIAYLAGQTHITAKQRLTEEAIKIINNAPADKQLEHFKSISQKITVNIINKKEAENIKTLGELSIEFTEKFINKINRTDNTQLSRGI